MQTFLPYQDFNKSAKCLDYRRLGKQRVEVLQILRALYGETKGWCNHPATKMWSGSESWLVLYGSNMCSEWLNRGYKDTCLAKMQKYYTNADESNYPEWLKTDRICKSHRAALLAKDIKYYSQFGWIEKPEVNYWWPTKEL